MFGKDCDLVNLVGLNAKAIDLLATSAVPNSAWCDGVREHALNILALADEMQASLSPRSATEVN
jgi:hypothetical protein